MKKYLIPAVLTAVLLCTCAAGAELEQLASLRAVYDKSLATIVSEYRASCSNLNTEYLNALKILKESVQKQGDLEGLRAVSAEIARFEVEKNMPDGAVSIDRPHLASLQTRYKDSASKASASKARKLVSLADQYEGRLVQLMKQLTKEGKISEATEIDAETKRLKASEEIASARFELAEYAAERIRSENEEEEEMADIEPAEPENDRKEKIARLKSRAKRTGKADKDDDSGGLLKNGGFSSGRIRWDTDKDMRVIDDEDNQVMVIELDNNRDRYLRQRFKRGEEAGPLSVSMRMKGESENEEETFSYTLRFSYTGGSTYWTRSVKADREWKNVDWKLSFLRGGKSLAFSIEFHPGSGTIQVDDVAITED